ncbi:MAG: OB-fold domain-containing protein [Sphingomonadales bacterium]|nr:OB-fold domain-containing protein [Sphingomonadales bacterium]
MWEDDALWDGVRAGALALRACGSCGAICHPPLPMCPHCQSLTWDRRDVSGRARLVSWLVSTRPDRQEEAARIVAVAELAEGVRFVANMRDAGVDALHEGMALGLCFVDVDGETLPQFRPAEGAA